MELAQPDAGAPVVDLADAAVSGGRATDAIQPAPAAEQSAAKSANQGQTAEAAENAAAAQAALAAAKPPEPAKPGIDPAAAQSPTGQVLEHGGPILTAGTMPSAPIEQKKKSFLSSFFGSGAAEADAAAIAPREPKAKPVIALPDPNESKRKEQAAVSFAALGAADDGIDDGSGDFALPGVRKTNLFEIKRKSGLDDDSDIDVYEDIGTYEVASAAGLARLAPNGLLKQRETVDTACLKPKLVRMLKQIEQHFGKRLIVTSGYRSPAYNRKVRGAEKSQHMYCAAVDVQLPGVHKFELARYARTMPGRGGVGTYCHSSIHIDIGPERDWNWKCGGRKT